jgi:hypothetical protein
MAVSISARAGKKGKVPCIPDLGIVSYEVDLNGQDEAPVRERDDLLEVM